MSCTNEQTSSHREGTWETWQGAAGRKHKDTTDGAGRPPTQSRLRLTPGTPDHGALPQKLILHTRWKLLDSPSIIH